MEFPPFELLHWFERTEGKGFLHISHSEILGFRFSEFGKEFPDLDLGEAFPRGSPKLRSLIGAQHQIWPDQVLVCNGASEANFLVQAALLSPGDEVLVENPLYPPLREGLAGFGAAVRRVPRLPAEGWRLDLDALERAITAKTKLVVLTNLNNPTGGMLRAADLRRLADLAEAHGFHVHVDETFRELAFDQAPPTAASFGPRFLVTSTLTKAFGLGGLRLGWVVGAPDLIERVKSVKDYASICPSRVSEELAMWALSRKEEFLARAERICVANRAVVRAWLDQNADVECVLPDYGNLCFPRLPVGVDALAEKLRDQYRVVIAPGRFFGMREHFRLGYGGKKADLEKGLEHLAMAKRVVERTQKAQGTQ
ncbi:MAG TPA: pyridoxal phosphate-dependent aminotransferase [Thermoplasmata archaeon]|nr:pyridoxal phosphate-dependent aminotransferase [Thermoplasmata archaeon]